MKDLRQQIAHIRHLQERYARPIIAAGVFSNGEIWTNLLGSLTTAVEKKYREPVNQLFDRLHAAGNDLRVPVPIEDDPDHMENADDAVFSYAIGYGDEGFLLGLAVGMRLGPNALDVMEPPSARGGKR